MNVETIRDLHAYIDWANSRVFECAAAIPAEQFVAENGLPWGSIRNQMVHQIIVHQRWLSWADGSMSGEEAYQLSVEMDNYPEIESARAFWTEVQRQNHRFLESMSESDLRRDLSVSSPGFEFSVPVGQVMIHIAHHYMQHRTEMAMELTRLGHSPGDLDYLFYVLEQNAARTS